MAGHLRFKPSEKTYQYLIWNWIRQRKTPWAIEDVCNEIGVSPRHARRYIQRLSASYLKFKGYREEGPGQFNSRLWVLKRNTGRYAPVLVGGAFGNQVRDLNH